MCGIVTIFAYGGSQVVNRDEVRRIRDNMAVRGPDSSGEWFSIDNRVGLGHRRLSIIDLSETGFQPMANEDKSLIVTFNGEIYNYRELRTTLEKAGYRFKSTSDTEVLLHLYAYKGEEMVDDLRGMYAFCIWDSRKNGIFLARDPFGIKPLYYSDDGKTLRVASQVRALLEGRSIDTSPEPAGHVGFFLWGFVPEPYTLFKGIRELPPGTSMWFDDSGNKKIRTFFSLKNEIANTSGIQLDKDASYYTENLRKMVLDSLRHHLISDVPIGVFLSSGIDSSTLTALCSEISPDIMNGVTLGFREYRGTNYDETLLAKIVGQQYAIAHKTIWVSRSDFDNELPRLFQAMDQPSIDGTNSYFVSLAAVKSGLKVALSGLGGDELFGGYPSFEQIPRMVHILGKSKAVPSFGKAFRSLSTPLLKKLTSPKYSGLFEYGGTIGGSYLLRRGLFMPWELPDILDGDIVKEGWEELKPITQIEENLRGIGPDYLKIMLLEMSIYMQNQLLRDMDWASMAHSLEARVPLLDITLFRNILPMLGKTGLRKPDLAKTPARPLPDGVLTRKKTGFAIPVREWITDVGKDGHERGLRGWAKRIYEEYPGALSMRGRSAMRNKPLQKRRKTLLLFRIGLLGDTLVALPAIKAIREKYIDYRIVLLTEQRQGVKFISSWDVLRPTGYIDEVLFYTTGKVSLGVKFNDVRTLVKELKRLAPEIIFNLSPDRKMLQKKRDALFFKKLVGAQHYVEGDNFTIHAKNPDGSLPLVEPEWRKLLQVTGATDDTPFRLAIPEEEESETKALLHIERIPLNSPLIAIAPGSKMQAKRWPIERFVGVASRLLLSFPGIRLILLGGKEETEIGLKFMQQMEGNVYNMIGKLSIYGSAAVLKRCIAYVGNDTGTMHLAAMVGTPCVAIFSARDFPGKWDPYGVGHAVLRSNPECSGCMLETCVEHDNKCLKMITEDEVLTALLNLTIDGKKLSTLLNLRSICLSNLDKEISRCEQH